MDSAVVAPAHRHAYEEAPPRVGLADVVEGEEHHQEKKPVLKKVKEKMKNIKDTIGKKKHGGHHGDNHHDHEEVEEEEERYEEDDDERLEDAAPELHGAPTPTYDTTTTKNDTAGAPQTSVALRAMTANLEEDPAAPERGSGTFTASDQNRPSYPLSSGGDEVGESAVIKSLQAMTVDEDKPAPPTGTHDESAPSPEPGPTTEKKPTGTDEPTKEAAEQSYAEKFSSTAKSAAVGSAEYGKKIASTVYDKVAVAGTAVMAKVQGGPTGKDGGDAKSGQDKGVTVREYLAAKLRPGEEDKALSEVISEAIKKKRAEEEGTEVTGPGEKGVTMGVVEKIRGAVTSLIGGGDGSRAPPATDANRKEAEIGEGSTQGLDPTQEKDVE